jgi:hypothetical protein
MCSSVRDMGWNNALDRVVSGSWHLLTMAPLAMFVNKHIRSSRRLRSEHIERCTPSLQELYFQQHTFAAPASNHELH